MKTGKSLVELAQEIERRANAKRDLVVNSKDVELYAPTIKSEPKLVVANQEPVEVTELAHDQLGNYCDIPAKYYDRCRAESPVLLAQNVNHWLRQKAEPRMVRTLDNKARAFLSDRYRPLENEDLAEQLLPILLGEDSFDLMSCEVTEKRLYLKVVSKAVNRELAKTGNHLGDGQHKIVRVLAPAITVSNSEVGCGSLSIQAGVFDGWCSNLATFEQRSMRKYHIGARHDLLGDDIVAMLSDDTRKKTDTALWAQVRDVLKNAFNVAMFNALVDQIEGTRAGTLPKEADVVKVVSLSSRRLGITEGEEKGVLQHLIAGGELNRYGLYNAITAYSQTVESYDRATELERVGGQLIELPAHDWQRIVNQSAN